MKENNFILYLKNNMKECFRYLSPEVREVFSLAIQKAIQLERILPAYQTGTDRIPIIPKANQVQIGRIEIFYGLLKYNTNSTIPRIFKFNYKDMLHHIPKRYCKSNTLLGIPAVIPNIQGFNYNDKRVTFVVNSAGTSKGKFVTRWEQYRKMKDRIAHKLFDKYPTVSYRDEIHFTWFTYKILCMALDESFISGVGDYVYPEHLLLSLLKILHQWVENTPNDCAIQKEIGWCYKSDTSLHLLYTILIGYLNVDLESSINDVSHELSKIEDVRLRLNKNFYVNGSQDSTFPIGDQETLYLKIALSILAEKAARYQISKNRFSVTLAKFNAGILNLWNRLLFGRQFKNKFDYFHARARNLRRLGVNLNKQAIEGQLPEFFGRDDEIRIVIRILGSRRKGNPLLLGEPGVGKTAIVEGVAQRIERKLIPDFLKPRMLVSIDAGQFIAGTGLRGDFETKLVNITTELKRSKFHYPIILIIDEFHLIVSPREASPQHSSTAHTLGNFLKPALSRGDFQAIGATTRAEFSQKVEHDGALIRRFGLVNIGEPDIKDTLKILIGLKKSYQEYYNLLIPNQILELITAASERYFPTKFFPDKAVDLMDAICAFIGTTRTKKSRIDNLDLKLELEIGGIFQFFHKYWKHSWLYDEFDEEKVKSFILKRQRQFDLKKRILTFRESLKIENEKMVSLTEKDILHILATRTGIKNLSVSKNKLADVEKLEENLKSRIIGQNEAITSISSCIKRNSAGLGKSRKRPIGSFLFVGPTGVGKTELVKVLSLKLFESLDALLSIDMSEYAENFTITRLIGSAVGYIGYDEGGLLTERIRLKPSSIILLDEVEKAHPDIFNLLLQICEEGRLTDSKGIIVDFTSTIVILTSNVGSQRMQNRIKSNFFQLKESKSDLLNSLKADINEEIKKIFRPELLNRLEDVIIFTPLTKAEISKIAEIMLKDFSELVHKQTGVQLEFTDRFKRLLVDQGFNPSYGARPLRRAITRLMANPISEQSISKNLDEGDLILFDLENLKIVKN